MASERRSSELVREAVVPCEETRDALARIRLDAESGTYVFLTQQWKPGGQSGYKGGSLLYASSVSSVEVRTHIDEEKFWKSFEPWSEEDAEEIRENIRRACEGVLLLEGCASLPFELSYRH